ncbi:aldo/keto reductase [Clostridium sp. DL-VIII]|uniref:aldo/keto reductase n=1 Tax=Clostridium sp. DL-VIII TaxID=641107 RepID=UPI00023AF118|nr:aldo/keto reductase [Clostridium sp. DL-VIII]EHI97576.1 aldo/keto reductase [Clostridium sp. DL-VIII]
MPNNEILEMREVIEKRKVILPDGTKVSALGQGTWFMGESQSKRDSEIKALKLGLELGMNFIDTAEMYGNGLSEELISHVIDGCRKDVFLVSKVYPHNAGRNSIVEACENSLRRLKTDYLDLYLLHWRGRIPFEETIEGMELLKKQGKILRWGVSNLDKDDMEELFHKSNGENCAVNEVLYHIGSRGIEFDLLPWQRNNNIPTIAYCPLAQGGSLERNILRDDTLNEIAKEHNVKPLQIALAWTIRENDIISIPKAASVEHVIENAKAASIILSPSDIARLDKIFKKPSRKMPLDIV